MEAREQVARENAIVERGDEELLDQVRAGSARAFDDIMKRYQRCVYAACLPFAADSEEALDMMQDIFVKVYEKIGSFQGNGTFRAWLLRIAYHEGVNRVRYRARHGEHDELTRANEPAVSANQDSELLRQESQDLLRSALLQLNPRQRQAVTLRYFEKMPIREIASILDCTDGTAKNLLFRSLQKLRAHLAPEWRES